MSSTLVPLELPQISLSLSSMLVDVVVMRRHGDKLNRSELLGAPPVRGVLSIDTYAAARPGDKGTTYAALTNLRRSEPLLPALRDARVSRLRGNEFVLHGLDTTVPKIGNSTTWPQAWWCRLVEGDVEAGHQSPEGAGLADSSGASRSAARSRAAGRCS